MTVIYIEIQEIMNKIKINITDDIDLCVFISSKNRYGRYNDYKITIKHLFNICKNKQFKNKFLSLKIFKEDIENANNIINFFSNLGFKIYIINDDRDITSDDRYNNRQKFIGGITKDICNFFLNHNDKLSEYVFILEDDSPIIIKKYSLNYFLNKSIQELKNNNDLEGIHFLRLSYNEMPISPENWFFFHKQNILDQQEIIKTDYWYNFQPRVNRTKDIINICNIIQNKWDEYFQFLHPEDAFDKAYNLYNSNIRYYAFSPFFTYSIHLGADPYYHEKIVNSETIIKNLYNNYL